MRGLYLLLSFIIIFHRFYSAYAGEKNVPITGELVYPLPFQFNNLGLPSFITPEMKIYFKASIHYKATNNAKNWPQWVQNELDKKPEDYKNKRVLSLGEGVSAFVPWLNEANRIEAYGIDLWYGDPIHDEGQKDEEIREFLGKFYKRYAPYLIRDDAVTLANIKSNLKNDARFDLIIGHFLLEYIQSRDRETMLRNCLSVLNPGGSLRLNNANDHVFTWDETRGNFRASDAEIPLGTILEKLKEDYEFEFVILQGKSNIRLIPPRKVTDNLQFYDFLNEAYYLDYEYLLYDSFQAMLFDRFETSWFKKFYYRTFYDEFLTNYHKKQNILILHYHGPRKKEPAVRH